MLYLSLLNKVNSVKYKFCEIKFSLLMLLKSESELTNNETNSFLNLFYSKMLKLFYPQVTNYNFI